MPASPLSSFGERIRAERIRQGRSLRALAREVGVSPSMMSQIETGKTRPSVSTLFAITTTLRIPLDDIFDSSDVDRATDVAISVHSGDWSERDAGAPQARLGPRVEPAQRQPLDLGTGVICERLGTLPPLPVEFLLATFEPGTSSAGVTDGTGHPGSEFAFVLQGELVVTLGGDEMALRPGDAISFDAATPHRYRNDTAQRAVGIWFVVVS